MKTIKAFGFLPSRGELEIAHTAASKVYWAVRLTVFLARKGAGSIAAAKTFAAKAADKAEAKEFSRALNLLRVRGEP
jgi:hypothetical protein